MNPTTSFYHDTRRAKNYPSYPEGHPLYKTPITEEKLKSELIYPVKLRVTYNRKQYYYPYPNCDLTKSDFAKVFSPKPREKYKKIQDDLFAERKVADDIIKALGKKFTINLFNIKFSKPGGGSTDLFFCLATLETELRENDQISTAVLTKCALESLKKFHTKAKLSIEDVDINFLNKYEKWMRESGKSSTTIGMYLRRIRVIFTKAIKEGSISSEHYPFKDFEIPVGRNIKKALSHYDVGVIARYKPQSESQEKARDFWLLTYYCNGMNMKDIALLKQKNIDGNMIRYESGSAD